MKNISANCAPRVRIFKLPALFAWTRNEQTKSVYEFNCYKQSWQIKTKWANLIEYRPNMSIKQRLLIQFKRNSILKWAEKILIVNVVISFSPGFKCIFHFIFDSSIFSLSVSLGSFALNLYILDESDILDYFVDVHFFSYFGYWCGLTGWSLTFNLYFNWKVFTHKKW